MVCHNCRSEMKKFGFQGRRRLQRYRCRQCGKTFSADGPLAEMRTPVEKAAHIVSCLVEGCSVWSTARSVGVHKRTVIAVLRLAGQRCKALMERRIRQIPVSDVECDEMWGFVGCKEKRNFTGDPERGDAYCFVAIERNTKLILTWHLGRRTRPDTEVFIDKLSEATAGQFQITTDGFRPYFEAVHYSLGTRVDFAQLIKVYAAPAEDEHRYSPARVVAAIPEPKWGQPDPKRICTSHVERQNLTMRMQIRRLTRLTNAFSKKRENLKAALALYFGWYNFVRVHQSLRVTPAMESGLTGHIWTIPELLISGE